jgi:hypothetical protein
MYQSECSLAQRFFQPFFKTSGEKTQIVFALLILKPVLAGRNDGWLNVWAVTSFIKDLFRFKYSAVAIAI